MGKPTYTLCEIWNGADRRICFVLGAGASKSSGIRTGSELAKQWLAEIKERVSEQPEKFKQFLEEENIDEENPALSYPILYSERFKFDKDSGFEFINSEMEKAKPGYGYSVLAQMMAEKQHNIVITTNFDNLTEEALYTYTSKRPLICGNESLAVFAKPSVNRPLIVKIHRDRYFNPQSKKDEIDVMNKLWVDALNNIFSASTPVFIGYGGNDGSMMGYMEKVAVINNLFWCERKGAKISDRVEKLLERHNGKLVEIQGYDELMFLLQDSLKLKLLDKEIVDIAQIRATNYRETFENIRNQQSKSTDVDAQKAAERIVQKADEKTWWSWALKAQAAKTDEEKEAIYLEGLKNLPNSSELNGTYAIFLYLNKKDHNKAEKYYQRSLKLDPNNAITNLNYGLFLYTDRRNYDEAEKYYLRSLELDPNNSITNRSYGNLLFTVRKNYDKAGKYYKRALELDSSSVDNNANYGNFLSQDSNKYDEAEKYYRLALELNPNNSIINGNYASFLFINRKNYDEAEKYYKRALELDPNNSIINGNYANFLHNIRKNYDEAEKYYKRALEIDSDDASINGNYANFLNGVRKNYDEAEKYYKHALEIDSDDANNNGNYAGFLFSRGNKETALNYLTKAVKNHIKEDLLTESWFYKYAHLENDRENSLKELHRLICNEKARSVNFNLQNNVDMAIKEGHPNPKLLQQIADIITKDAPADEFCSMNI